MSDIAAALSETGSATAYANQHAKGQAAYHKRFFSEATGGYSPCINGHGTAPKNMK